MESMIIEEIQKPMTFESFATSIQEDLLGLWKDMNEGFASIHVKMATKQDLADLRDEMISRFATHSELQSALGALKDELLEEIKKIKYAKEIDELRTRMNRVESELSLGRSSSLA